MQDDAFFLNLGRHVGTAFIVDDQPISYQVLERQVQNMATYLEQACKNEQGEAALMALPFTTSFAAVVFYLAALRAQIPVLVVDPNLNTGLKDNLYQQLGVGFAVNSQAELEFFITQSIKQPAKHSLKHSTEPPLEPFLERLQAQPPLRAGAGQAALLVSTSGSSGSPKAVMLSTTNLQANCQSILSYLPMQASDVAITSLPFHYSFGLSILHSHLAIGACLVLTDHSLLAREFWQLVKQHQVTSLSGVPFHYQMLQRLRIERMELPHLRYLTQAGGKLDPHSVAFFAQLAQERHWQFFVMYGQTEATARIAYVPAELIAEHTDVIGQAIPNGQLKIKHLISQEWITNSEEEGELWYFGDNIMLGYAEQAADWQQARLPLSALATGDLACWTSAGLVKITGRMSRFIKIRGKRLQLDHIEQTLANRGFKVYCCGQDEQLFFAFSASAAEKPGYQKGIQELAADELALHPSLWAQVTVAAIPYLGNGKVNYAELLRLCQQEQEPQQ